MERIALKELIEWNNNPTRKPLVIWGARQTGKTYLAKELFAERYYNRKYIYIDFRKEQQTRLFCSNCVDATKIVTFLEAEKKRKIDSSTLLIFDEVQECPAIITALKYFNQDIPEIPVIATGSMVRIKIRRMVRDSRSNNEGFLFPVGKINQLTVHPMTFEEFMMNYNPSLLQFIENAYEKKEPLHSSFHELALECLSKYLLVGGMPEAVASFLKKESFYDARVVLKDLYDNYLADMDLYQASEESILRSRKTFSNIYKQLNKDSKNFSPGLIEEKARCRDFFNPIEWLVTAGVILRSYQLKEHVTAPLIEESDSAFRLYLSDVGMFSYQSGINASTLISKENWNTLAGIFIENYVATELTANDIKLFFWKGKNNAELEFLIESGRQIIPLDAKKSRGTLNSIEKYKDHNSCPLAVKVSQNNFGYDNEKGILTIPLYELFLFLRDVKNDSETVMTNLQPQGIIEP